MNFLELCQALASKAAVSGAIVSVVDQTGEARRVVNWIAEAYGMVQLEHTDWTFLRRDAGFDTVAETAAYAADGVGIAEFGEWRFQDDWRSYRTSIGVLDEQPVRFVPFDDFRRRYLFGSNRLVTGRPLIVTEQPDQSLHFWPIPDAAYTIVGEQFRAPARLVANNDVPIFAAKFHDVIVYRALMLYGAYEGDATVFAAAQTECSRLIGQMEERYLPEWDQPGPMA